MRLAVFSILSFIVFLAGCANHNQLGNKYWNKGDYQKAKHHYLKAANGGDKYAQYNLANMYRDGNGMPVDIEWAAAWYVNSAKQDFMPAVVQAGKMQRKLGYEEAALSWLNYAARWNEQEAIDELIDWGKPVPEKDLWIKKRKEEILGWSEKASNGDYLAQYKMGEVFETGLEWAPLEADLEVAIGYFGLSAKQGYVPAMAKVGILAKKMGYDEVALNWLVLAARWGNQSAISALSEWGKGIPPADLLHEKNRREQLAKERAQAEADQAIADAAYQIGCALGGGGSACSENNSSLSHEQKASGSSTKRKCDSDYDCGAGFSCLKELYASSGVCVESYNAQGVRSYSPDVNSTLPNLEASCQVITDCPVGFFCDQKYGRCIKQ